jgi:hypothetical protein
LNNENANKIGFWEEDKNNISPLRITRFMAVNNCIAHPSIMAKADTFKQYQYDSEQHQAEDYDLWLRMLADGREFHKLPDVLLLHRILPRSFTRSQQKNIFYKLAETKSRFFVRQLAKGRLNSFTLRTALFSITDSLRGFFKAIKLFFNR